METTTETIEWATYRWTHDFHVSEGSLPESCRCCGQPYTRSGTADEFATAMRRELNWIAAEVRGLGIIDLTDDPDVEGEWTAENAFAKVGDYVPAADVPVGDWQPDNITAAIGREGDELVIVFTCHVGLYGEDVETVLVNEVANVRLAVQS